MEKKILLLLAVGVLLLAGCASTVNTIVYKDGKTTLTEERGGKVIGYWELQQVLGAEEKNKLRREGWKYEGIVHNPSGPDTFLMKRRISPPIVAAARPEFHPMLITTFGTNTSPDGTWRIGVSETALDFSRLISVGEGDASPLSNSSSTLSPGAWKARAGWFVFIESKSHVWAYDGDSRLVLNIENVESTNGNSSSGGAIYEGGYPCAVPDEVLSRLPEPAKKKIRLN